jgi:hypothetical protein
MLPLITCPTNAGYVGSTRVRSGSFGERRLGSFGERRLGSFGANGIGFTWREEFKFVPHVE